MLKRSGTDLDVEIKFCSYVPENLQSLAHPILSSLRLESAQTEQYQQSYGHFSVMGWLWFWFEVVLALLSGVCSSCGHAGFTGTNRAWNGQACAEIQGLQWCM